MTYKTLGGGLDLSLSMESKSNSLPLMMSAGGRFGGIFKGFWGSIFEHPEVKDGKKTANIAIWRWRKRSIPTHSGWLYPLTFDAGKGVKED